MTEHQHPETGPGAAGRPPGRLRTAAVTGVAALVGATLGVGGVSLALWQDDVAFAGSISDGYEYFAAGPAGGTVTAATAATPQNKVPVTVGSTEAATLLNDGAVAVAFETQSLSQGNKGLEYTVAPPTSWGNNIFGAAADEDGIAVFQVSSADQCDTDATPSSSPLDDLYSQPVEAAYSTDTAPDTEYWCLVATLESPPDEGSYTNEATVKAEDPGGTTVDDKDSWTADVTTALDPQDEADHEITFTYTTFRPGGATTP